jgi:anti-sigma regulatory factor (Ser/Thr protein kinase)
VIDKAAASPRHDAVSLRSAIRAGQYRPKNGCEPEGGRMQISADGANGQPEPEMAVLVLEPTDRAPGHARRFVAERFRELGIADDYVGRLVVTELVTNAYMHVGFGVVVVRVVPEGRGQVVIEVWDEGEDWPVLKGEHLGSTCGRGLLMMEQLVAGWGVRPLNERGKVVWARCATA